MRNTLVNTPIRKLAKFTLIALLGAVLMPMVAVADTAEEIKAMIMKDNADVRKNLSSSEDGYSKHGSLEFWSSGGLMQYVPADSPAATWEQYSLTAKHIKVITLVEDKAAVAMYYSEGAFQETGQAAVSHYMCICKGRWQMEAACCPFFSNRCRPGDSANSGGLVLSII